MIIRRINKNDLENYRRLRNESTKEYSKIRKKKISLSDKIIKDRFKELLSSPNQLLLFAEEDNQTIAYIAISFHNNDGQRFAYINDIFVSKDYRRKGIAMQLIKETTQILKNKKIKKLGLGVYFNNEKAINLYKKFGFKLTYYEMEKELK